MWLLITLLLWVPVRGQTDLTKSVITLKPPWVNIFQEEAVTFWCEAPPVPGNSSTQWFINGTVIQTLTPSYTIASASVNNSGEYKCQTGLSVPSDPVQLQIYRDWLLLQVYSRILTEGEPLTLKCHGWKNKLVYKVLFYQDGKTFKFCPRDSIFTILKTSRHNQGIYHCSGMGKHRYRSKGVFITIRELFTVPMLRVSSLLPLREGNQVNLSCETKLLQQRPNLQLYFSFYMGNMTLLSRDTSSEYQILNAKREDSGFYWCEAVTDNGKVLKRSLELDLQVLDLQSQITVGLHVLSHLAPATMYLVSTVFYIIIHKDLQKKKKQNLDISLESGHEKKATSCNQKDKHLEEESQCQDEEGHPQESTPQKVPQEEAKPSECP